MSHVIETARLRLRPLTPDDLEFLAGMLGDPEVMRHYPAVLDRDGAAAWLDRQLQREARDGVALRLAEERTSGRPVGQIGVLRQLLEGETEASLEVGYLLLREAWGHGYATEGARAARDWAFARCAAPRVISLIRPENARSQRVAARNGFVVVRRVMHAGLPHDVWAMERRVWLAGMVPAPEAPSPAPAPSAGGRSPS